MNKNEFDNRILQYLERIAIALESQVPPTSYSPIDPVGRGMSNPETLRDDFEELPPQKALQMIQATHCTCGTNFDRICTQCTPARLAEVYRRRDA